MADIIFLADGTWNGPGETEDSTLALTNVYKTFSLLAGEPEPPGARSIDKVQLRRLRDASGATVQLAQYLHGVGDVDLGLLRLAGGAFGVGVIARIVAGYVFLSQHWQPGSRIVLVGFSRGAYIVRALAGMVTRLGLMAAADCADAHRAGRVAAFLWGQYLALRQHPDAPLPPWGSAQDLLSNPMAGEQGGPARPSAPLRPAGVDVVAVWDTVGALGIPRYDAFDERVDVFRFCGCALSSERTRGYHALAWEERRVDFTPTLWDPRPGVEQMLFAGAHGDVGGGYPVDDGQSDLAHLALGWMVEKLRDVEGLRFADDPARRFPGSAFGPSHQPWTEGSWVRRPQAARDDERFLALPRHPSLLARQASGQAFTVLPSQRLETPRG